MTFTDAELDRYARQLVLREIGGAGQQRLKAARVLIVGAGGLGSPAALYLAAAGVGVIGLADPDCVARSNLQRQILYGCDDLDQAKPEAGAHRLNDLNPFVEVRPLPVRIQESNAAELIGAYDIVLDGTDEFATRFAVNAGCFSARRPLVSGAIGRWAGQVAVFEAGPTRDLPIEQRRPCYRCLVRDMPPDGETCAAVGVLGALAGVIGSIMAAEAVKWITGAGETLSGRLLLFDALNAEARTVVLRPDPACPLCGERR